MIKLLSEFNKKTSKINNFIFIFYINIIFVQKTLKQKIFKSENETSAS